MEETIPKRKLEKKFKVYIAGPMTGYKEHNFPAFMELEEKLRERGFIPVNPAGNPPGLSQADYMKIDIAMLSICDYIIMLPGWENSIGARAEYHTAASFRIPELTYADLMSYWTELEMNMGTSPV